MKRNLRFWTRFTWEYLEAELIVVGVFLLMSIINSELIWAGGMTGILDVLALLPFYLIISAVLCMMMIAPGCQMLYVPLLISCGETRRNIFWGCQYFRFLLIAVTAAVSALVWLLVPCDVSSAGLQCLPLIITGLAIASALGNLVGLVYVRWKWVGVVVIALVFGIFGGVCGWMGSTGGFDFAGLPVVSTVLSNLYLPWPVVAAAAVLLAADLGCQWLLLRRREVKF